MDVDCYRIFQLPDNATHYEVFGIERSGVTDDIIKKRYRELALKCHPDKHITNENYTKLFQRINEANEILSDADKRTEYDRKLDTHVVDYEFTTDSGASYGPSSVSTVVRETHDLGLTPSKLDERNKNHFGPLKTEDEGDRIKKLQLWLSELKRSISQYETLTYDEVIVLFENTIDPLLSNGYDRTNRRILEYYYGIVDFVIVKWINEESSFNDAKATWILNKINALMSVLPRILPLHKTLLLDNYKLFVKILPKYKDLSRNIERFRSEQTRPGGSRRKSIHKRRQRNKRRTQRKKSYRKYKNK